MKKLIYFTLFLSLQTLALANDKCGEIADLNALKKEYQEMQVMDVSRTEVATTLVKKIQNKQDIINAICYAKKNNLKVTIKGTNHSHGGHNRRNINGLQLDMLNYKKIIALDTEKLEVTVQSGLTWNTLASYLNGYGLANKTQQSSNIFSIGGSISTDIHGRDIHGPFFNSIKEIKFIDSYGEEQVASREINFDQFRAIIGGYGAIGVITEVTLKIEPNYLYRAQTVKEASISSYVSYLKTLKNKDERYMHYGRANIFGKKSYTKISYVEWQVVNKNSKDKNWKGWKIKKNSENTWPAAILLNLIRMEKTSKLGKYAKDILDSKFNIAKTGTYKTKNNVMNNGVDFLFDHFYNKNESVDILQEYFIPINNLEPYLNKMRTVISKYDLNLLNITFRYIPQITNEEKSFLSPYSTKSDLVAIVLYFNIQEDKKQGNGHIVKYDGSKWTKELIEHAQAQGGSFYWPYNRWWDEKQVLINKEEDIQQFFEVKKLTDPDNLFESDFMFHLKQIGIKFGLVN